MDWEPTVKLPAKWRSLLPKLWASDEKSIADFLPEIIALIKTTKPSVAATGLFTVMHSPKVQDCFRNLKLRTPAIAVPSYLTNKLYADAAGLPVGEVRKKAVANLNRAEKEDGVAKALTMEDAVKIFEEFAKEEGEASAKRARRARKLLGIPRQRGRPKSGQT